MTIGLISFTKAGAQTQLRLQQALQQQGYEVQSYQKERHPRYQAWVQSQWKQDNVLIFIGATGIAVRGIAPLVQDKMTDPAVLVLDEQANYCISLLSGHLGGANAWATTVANMMEATAIITTATDLNQLFAVDLFAKQNQLQITDRVLAKRVSAKILAGQTVSMMSEVPIKGKMPVEIHLSTTTEEFGVYVGVQQNSPFHTTLYLVPTVLSVGIGCKKGTSIEAITALYEQVMTAYQLREDAVTMVASIDLKQEEPGLLAFCQQRQLPFITYSAAQLAQVQGDFAPSSFVQSVTGVDNICERSAVLSSQNGTLLVHKTSRQGVTLAVAMKKWSLTNE